MGATVIGSPGGNWSSRVMHMRRGLPFTSALHEPHRPALQFQRQARSLAACAWMWCTASRTTIPSWSGTVKSSNRPSSRVPRKTLSSASLTSSHLALDDAFQLVGHRWDRLLRDRHRAVAPADDDVHRAELLLRIGILDARVGAAALAPLE